MLILRSGKKKRAAPKKSPAKKSPVGSSRRGSTAARGASGSGGGGSGAATGGGAGGAGGSGGGGGDGGDEGADAVPLVVNPVPPARTWETVPAVNIAEVESALDDPARVQGVVDQAGYFTLYIEDGVVLLVLFKPEGAQEKVWVSLPAGRIQTMTVKDDHFIEFKLERGAGSFLLRLPFNLFRYVVNQHRIAPEVSDPTHELRCFDCAVQPFVVR